MPLITQTTSTARATAGPLIRIGLFIVVMIACLLFADDVVATDEELEHTLCYIDTDGWRRTCVYVDHPLTYGPPASFPSFGGRQ